MEDYKDMYPRLVPPEEPKQPDPYRDPIGSFPENPDWSGVRSAAEPVPQDENAPVTMPEIPEAEQAFPDPARPQAAPETSQNAAPVTPPPAPQPRPVPPPPMASSPGAFYGDPSAPVGQTPDYGWQVPPVVPPEKPLTMNRRIYTMCAVIAALIFLLCIYCIGSDVLHGAMSGEELRPVTVKLETQQKPELSLDDKDVTADGEYTVHSVAERVQPSIVEVYSYSGSSAALGGSASGVILSDNGYIVTNAHVVEGYTNFEVIVGGDEETTYSAEVIGSDPKTDLAVLKIDAHGLVPAVFGDSDETYVGENVVAIGNPAGLTNTVTKGIVSAIGRQVRSDRTGFRMECIQTDAAISPGNSGGALVNMYGQVIGITSSKYASMYNSAYEGLGFAITINQALPIVTDLMEKGYVSGRFRIGIVLASASAPAVQEEYEQLTGEPIPDELKDSIWISEISEDCDISHTDLMPNDFIVSVEGKKVTGYEDLVEVLDGYEPGDTVTAHCAHLEDGKITYFDISFKLEEDK